MRINIFALLFIVYTGAQAEQFLLIDTLFDFVIQQNPPYNGWQSHINLKFSHEVPTDWTIPDYAYGTVHTRFEIHSMPNAGKNTALQMCINKDNPSGTGNNTDWHTCHGCTNFSEPGVYRHQERLPWWTWPDQPTWNIMGTAYPQLVMKQGSGCRIPICTGCLWSNWSGYPDLTLYYPVTVRLTAFIVSKGASFEKPDYWDSQEFRDDTRSREHRAILNNAVAPALHTTQHGISIVLPHEAHVSVYSLDGTRMESLELSKNGELLFDRTKFRAGMYLVKVLPNEGKPWSRIVFVY